MKNLAFLFLIFSSIFSFSQIELPDKTKQEFRHNSFYEDFSKEPEDWYSTSKAIEFNRFDKILEIKQIKAITRRENAFKSVLNKNKVLLGSNFSLEAQYTNVKMGTTNGIIWDYQDDKNFYVFGILGFNNSFFISRVLNGKEYPLVKPEKVNFIKGFGEPNKLRIESKNGTSDFFINDIKVRYGEFKYSNNPTSIGNLFLASSNSGVFFFGKYIIDYFSFNKNKKNEDITEPIILITSPDVTRGFSIVKNAKKTTVSGRVTDESKIYEVLINGQEAHLDANGNFSKNVVLGVGENNFTVKATDVKMNSATKTFTIKREFERKETIITDNTKNISSDIISTGKYYALIIGNNEYKDQAIASLDEPIKDATKLYNVLTTKYAFSKENVILLKNATYVETITAFDKLGNTLTANDNLLVFYAGHGWWDETKDLGYWLPTDARKSNTAFWIRNSTISDYMASIKTKHTLLIADACFSGSIFKTRAAFDDASLAIKKLNDLPSKTAMTSGNLKEVPDKSVFLKFLVQRLNENSDKYLPADKLFSSFRIAVMNNSPNAPQFGTIQNAGDEGGEFIFVKKN